MLLEKFSFKKKKGVLITADFSAPTIEAYAMAWLKLTNVARETPNKIWSIQNDRRTNDVYVVCDSKAAEEVKRFLTGIVSFYMNGEVFAKLRDCKDTKGAHNRLEFWGNGKIVRVCDESELTETIRELESEGYIVLLG